MNIFFKCFFLTRCCQCPTYGDCSSHCPKSCPSQFPMSIQTGMTMTLESGNGLGSKALITCKPGYQINVIGKEKCQKSTHISCQMCPRFGAVWNIYHLSFPICIRLGRFWILFKLITSFIGRYFRHLFQ